MSATDSGSPPSTRRLLSLTPAAGAQVRRRSVDLGGPFTDRSGGLITFEADTPGRAEQLVTDDPFLREGIVSSWWLKQWLPEGADPTTSPAGER